MSNGFYTPTNEGRVAKMMEIIGHLEVSAKANRAQPEDWAKLLAPVSEKLRSLLPAPQMSGEGRVEAVAGASITPVGSGSNPVPPPALGYPGGMTEAQARQRAAELGGGLAARPYDFDDETNEWTRWGVTYWHNLCPGKGRDPAFRGYQKRFVET